MMTYDEFKLIKEDKYDDAESRSLRARGLKRIKILKRRAPRFCSN